MYCTILQPNFTYSQHGEL